MIILIFILAIMSGFIIGFERHMEDKPTGGRTFALTCMAGVLSIIIPQIIYNQNATFNSNILQINASRLLSYIAGALVFGVAFVKGKHNDKYIGFTTSMALLIVLFIGALYGLKQFILGIGLSILTFMVLKGGVIEYHIANYFQKRSKNESNR